tara:strand:- start:2258 stop:2953 length:696 start_codon:yes stop_codon:yes gene_type:complete
MENFKCNNVIIKNNYDYNNIKAKEIFILAGGQLKNGNVNSWVKERLDVGKIIYDSNEDSTIYCIGGGTYHKSPIVNSHGHVIHESKSCSNYLIKRGADSKRIKREWGSYDTIANGFFAFLNFIVPLKIKNIVVVTSLFHIERAQVIFDYFNKLFEVNIDIEYIGVENIIDDELLEIRKAREKKSVVSFKQNVVSKKDTIDKFFEWFYIEHNAYNCEEYLHDIDSEKVKESY